MKDFPCHYFPGLACLIIIVCFPFGITLAQITSSTYLIYNARIVDVVKGSLKKENSVLIEGEQVKAIGDYARLKKMFPPII